MGNTVDHACENCGAIRKVRKDKLAKGLQRLCRKCQGPSAAAKRSEAMKKRGGVRHITFMHCAECGNEYETKPIGDSGYCSASCEAKAKARGGKSMRDISRSFLTMKLVPDRESALIPPPPPRDWEQIEMWG